MTRKTCRGHCEKREEKKEGNAKFFVLSLDFMLGGFVVSLKSVSMKTFFFETQLPAFF